MLLFCIPMQLIHFDCVNGFLNSIKEIIWQTEAIYCCPLIEVPYLHPPPPQKSAAFWCSEVFVHQLYNEIIILLQASITVKMVIIICSSSGMLQISSLDQFHCVPWMFVLCTDQDNSKHTNYALMFYQDS